MLFERDIMTGTLALKEELEGSFLHVFLRSENTDKPYKMAIVNDANVTRHASGSTVRISFDPSRAVALPVGELADE